MTTLKDLADEVVRLALEKPKMKADCKYFKSDGSACCVVGHGLENLGLDVFNMKHAAKHAVGYNVNTTPFSSMNLQTFGIQLTTHEADLAPLNLIDRMQRWQDKGPEWGQALDMARAGLHPGDVSFRGSKGAA